MSDNDFFKYFKHVEICYLLFDAKLSKLTVTGEEKNPNGIVFNVITKGEGFLLCFCIKEKLENESRC